MQPVTLTKIEPSFDGQLLTLESDEIEAKVFYPGDFEQDRKDRLFVPNTMIDISAKFKQKHGFMITAYTDKVRLDDIGRLPYTSLEKIPDYADKLKQAAEIAKTLEDALKKLFA